MQLSNELKFTVGTPNTYLNSTAAGGTASVMFEDDGTTGYFYALRPGAEMQLLDALHVYDVADVADRQHPVTVQIVWDAAETAAALLIGGHCHALYDFQRAAGFCRTAYPPSATGPQLPRKLTDELVAHYFEA